MGKSKTPSHDLEKDEVVKPTMTYKVAKWVLLAMTVGLAIGILALIDQRLIYLPFTYDGPDLRYQGMTVNIFYCLLSSSNEGRQDSRCRFATAAAAISIGLGLLWLVFSASNKHAAEHKHRQRLFSCGWVTLIALWWLAAAIVITVWTDEANKADLPHKDDRNGLCVMFWGEFLLFGGLSTMLFLVVSDKMAKKLFTKKPKPDKAAAAAASVPVAAALPAAAVAAPAAAHVPVSHSPGVSPVPHAAAAGPAAGPAGGAWAPQGAAAGGPHGSAGGAAAGAGGIDDNPFRGGVKPEQPANVPVGPNAV